MKMNSFWQHFESIPSGKALLQVWQGIFGDEFRLVQPFLQPTTERAGFYPCPRNPPCDCDHEVRNDGEGRLVAVCTCGDGDCAPIQVLAQQTVIYELNRRALGNSLCRAMGWDTETVRATEYGIALEIGLYAPLHAPVFLCFPESDAALLRELQGLLCQREEPLLILTPTQEHLTMAVRHAVERSACAVLALHGTVEAQKGGGFRATKALAPALHQWAQRVASLRGKGEAIEKVLRELAAATDKIGGSLAKQPDVPEAVAVQAFAFVKSLESEQASRLGPPSVLTVFRLCCMEELSVSKIAKRVGCTKLTVLRRLKLIKERTKTNPLALRRYSAHFAQMEKQLRDPRAAHIHRKRMIDDEGESEADNG